MSKNMVIRKYYECQAIVSIKIMDTEADHSVKHSLINDQLTGKPLLQLEGK